MVLAREHTGPDHDQAGRSTARSGGRWQSGATAAAIDLSPQPEPRPHERRHLPTAGWRPDLPGQPRVSQSARLRKKSTSSQNTTAIANRRTRPLLSRTCMKTQAIRIALDAPND